MRKILSMLFALAMVMSCMSTVVFGAEATNVAKIGDVEYATFTEAYTAAKDGDTITLLANCVNPEVTIKKAITIDLGGKIITDAYLIIEKAVEITNGDIVNTEEPYPLVVKKGGHLTINDVDIKASKSDLAIWVDEGSATAPSTLTFNSGSILATKGENNTKTTIYAIQIRKNTQVNINGGTITVDAPGAKAIGIYGNYENANVNMTGGKISTNGGNYSYGINVNGDITVSGGEIVTNEKCYGYSSGISYNKNYAICNELGNVTVTGGKITTNGGSGYMVYAGRNYSAVDQTINISGVEFTNNLSEADAKGGHKAPALISGNSKAAINATITGGTFNGTSAELVTGSGTLTVSGGTFSTAPNAKYLAEGLEFKVNADGSTSYGEDAKSKAAKVGDAEYETVAEALKVAAETGASEVKILQSVRELLEDDLFVTIKSDLTITADSAVTVEFYNNGTSYDLILNGTNGEKLTIGENVTLTVSDRTIWIGYSGNNIDVFVDGALIGGYQLWFGGDVTVSETGAIASKGEALVARRGATLAVNGGTFDANYFSLLSGTVELNNITATTGPVWTASSAGYLGEGTGNLILNNSKLTVKGNMKLNNKASVTVTGGSELNITDEYGYGASVISEDCSLTIDTSSAVTSNAITGAGAIYIDASKFDGTEVSVLDTAGMSEFTGNVSVVNNSSADYEISDDGTVKVVAKPALPTATVTELKTSELNLTSPLTFALNFLADEVTDAQLEYYGNWYADYVLTVNKTATFNADGSADGYLAGQYDEWSENWVYVPFENVEIEENKPFKVMEYAAKLMNQPGLKLTYNDVYYGVKDFDCGIYFDDEFLAANPDLEVTLELRMYNPENEEESYAIGRTYEFKAADLKPEILKNSLYVTYTETGKWDFGAGETDSIKLSLFGGIDSLNYSEVGFDVTIGDKTERFPVKVVYGAVKTKLNGEVVTIPASEFGRGVNYIYGYTINFPATDEFENTEVEWSLYAKKGGKEIPGGKFTLDDFFPGTLSE